ncbi:murein hydrolase activator EnvC family protein [Sphingomonas jatrophae]|uniref:Septal ring factor EnvC, activator of murein hydrolases AmiA and AmiB n=1 Tax=Sphingomonas jatrophae TaxID=1166337 RepID=A0A1I6KXT2_9SPHN|nr:peptidoglycan DD-metalloendopeptidase family protein [Sphingomonas jatrophae]SFR96053.1 Septal ring factor EnvC, activator of murein hydrolases AmiA and AmiB [Sphingomonas jatrophae]
MRRAAALLLLVAAPALGQTIAEQARALIAAKRAAAAAQQRSAELEREARAAKGKAARLAAQVRAVGARIRSAEAEIDAARARVAIVEARRAAQRARLAQGRAPLARLAAALQTLARRPPGFALVQPGSVDDVIHVRALLSASLPVVEARTAALRAEVAEADRLAMQAAAAAATLGAGQARLGEERAALARLEAGARARAVQLADGALFQIDRATALGEKARDIVDLMEELGVQAEVRARLRSLPGPALRPPLPGLVALAPAPAGPPGGYRLPVAGRVVTGLGETARSGVRAKGITIATAPSARIVAPAAGRVAFAGPFRGYGAIVILDHGGGWTTLVAGLASASVRAGGRIAAGAPLGRAPAEEPRITLELRRHDRPVDALALAAG